METQPQIDHNLYSRQLGAYGVEAMGKLITLRVFLYGLRGLGVEIAKNLILAGPKRVIIQDDGIVNTRDLGSNFYCTEHHVGQVSRADASLEQLKLLNPYVDVQTHQGEVTTDFLANFDVVVFTDFYDRKRLIAFNNFCRNRDKPIGFIYGGSLGLYGFTFVDFGAKFSVFDATGEEAKQAILSAITNDNPGQVTTHEDKRHGFVDGDHVRFKEVEGMNEVNGQEYEIKVLSPYAFTINCDTTNFGKYDRNGLAEQIKVPVIATFKSLEESLQAPLGNGISYFENPDLDKWGRPEHLHLALVSLLDFFEDNQRLPELNSENDAAALLKLYEKNNSSTIEIEGSVKVEEINQELVKNIARYSAAQTSPHAAFFGGIIAQEVVKYTGKFMPLRQWLHYETFELLPEGQVNRTPLNCRYDDQISIFGQEFQENLMNKKLFLVGAGALGCEFIKQFALTGFCCGVKGKLTCTDDDNIEISNLNRQFLFRKENVGSSKSQTACDVGSRMNKDLKVEALKLRVSPENDEVFNDAFWEGLDAVTNAVDNVKARLFVDSRCVFYGRHLFESGTLGTKCNTQVIVPHQTQSYGDSQDPAEESIPLCTLKNFPYQIEHTIQWARDYFEGIFVEGPNEYQKYSENPGKYLQMVQQELRQQQNLLRSKLETVDKIARELSTASHESCVRLARDMFQDLFHNMIAQLLYTFPADHRNDSGLLFWSGLKRLPKILNYDDNDETHVSFVHSGANLFAYIFGLPPIASIEETRKIASHIKVHEFKPKKTYIKESDKDTKEEKAEDDDVRIAQLTQLLSTAQISEKAKINTIEFEKDDDSNYHIDFIAAVANLRARNYGIEEVTRHKVKMIAGKIIPAIATATAMIVGAVGFEMYKFVGKKDIGVYRNAFCNLAIPMWVFSEPLPPIKNADKDYDPIMMGPVKAVPTGWTNWDKIDVSGPKTLQEIFDFVKEKYGVNLSIVTIGDTMIYTTGMSPKDRLKMTPEEAYKKIKGEDFPPLRKFIEITASGETIPDNVDAIIPPIRYIRSK
jgi:ubiquitin-activating enzyme E1